MWLICIIASIGFAFDIYELLMLPLIIKPALAALGGVTESGTPVLVPGSPAYSAWARTLFFFPAVVGGIVGMLGGYLTDRLGRRRVLTWSILIYAFSAAASGFSTNLYQLLLFRCLVFVGVCVEFVAAVAWLAELFEDRDQRERVLGYTQAFSSVGGLMVGTANVMAANFASHLPAIHSGHEAWRYTLISGVIPALPLIVIRPFLPESPKWQQKRDAGLLRRPNVTELFSKQLAWTTIVTTICFAASYGMAFGAIQQLPQILSGHTQVKAEAQAAADRAAQAATAADRPAPAEAQLKVVARNASDEAVARVTIWQEIGGLVGRVLLAVLAVRIASRRGLLRVFGVPALIFVPALFWWIASNLDRDNSLPLIKFGAFVAGVLVVGQFSFWGNYIPRVFPLHLRGTGESFAANIGGRILGTLAAWFTLTFAAATPPNPARISQVGAIVAGLYCLIGMLLSFFLTEPAEELPD
jgi:nitrate/nitrite transporter NarK